jgi:hypothetical protein
MRHLNNELEIGHCVDVFLSSKPSGIEALAEDGCLHTKSPKGRDDFQLRSSPNINIRSPSDQQAVLSRWPPLILKIASRGRGTSTTQAVTQCLEIASFNSSASLLPRDHYGWRFGSSGKELVRIFHPTSWIRRKASRSCGRPGHELAGVYAEWAWMVE